MPEKKLPREALEFFKQAGRRGGQKGGKSRMDALSPEERTELARKAAAKSAEVRQKKALVLAISKFRGVLQRAGADTQTQNQISEELTAAESLLAEGEFSKAEARFLKARELCLSKPKPPAEMMTRSNAG
jgi:hypothetical protein